MRGEQLPEAIHDAVIERTGFKFDPKIEPDFAAEPHLSDAVRQVLIEKGYDGVIADLPSGGREYVAFRPEQIESAISGREPLKAAAAAVLESARRQPEGDAVAARDAVEVQARAPEPAAAADAQIAEAQRALDTVMKELQPEGAEPRPGGESRPASETVAEHPELREADEMVARAEGDARAYEKAAACLAEKGL